MKRALAGLTFLTLLASAAPAGAGVESTVHNLSRTGPGEIKATSEDEICIFCHAAHVPGGQTPLWNREVPNAANYKVYKSATMRSQSRQPDGASKLCLSCHDGTIALGKLLNRTKPVGFRGAGPRGELPAGRRSNLGKDLSGSHPVSIEYSDATLRNTGHEAALGAESGYAPRSGVAKEFLDAGGKVQCTTCHEPHENKYQTNGAPGFWRKPTIGEVCENCHLW